MENNNLHSFDEQLKAAMEQFTPTPPADVWANVSSQIGNISSVSQVTLVSKIATIVTKNIILISSVAAVVSTVVVYILSNDKNTISPKIETPIVVENNITDTKIPQNNSELPIEKTEESQNSNADINIKLKEENLDKKSKVEKTPKPTDILKENTDSKTDIEKPNGVTTDNIIQNILKQAKAPVQISEPKKSEVKKCNSDVQIIYNKLSDNNYYFEVKSNKEFNNYMWYLGDGFVEMNSKTLSHYYDINENEVYIVSLVVRKDGCKDSITKKILINKELKFDVYNVFTPNQDGQNEDWNIQINNPVFYNLKVIDYKGELVFETNKADEKWNGQKQNIGEHCAVGSYTYLLVYKINGQEITKTLKGRVDLLR